jgi:hypothetical protein
MTRGTRCDADSGADGHTRESYAAAYYRDQNASDILGVVPHIFRGTFAVGVGARRASLGPDVVYPERTFAVEKDPHGLQLGQG